MSSRVICEFVMTCIVYVTMYVWFYNYVPHKNFEVFVISFIDEQFYKYNLKC